MFGMKELKENIEITPTTVECPVKGCNEKVERQRRSFRRDEKFKCPKHNIYISPSTFEYQSELDNLLWKEKDDLDLLCRIKKVKRESRIARETSEDAVTWNVFRFLERNKVIHDLLGKKSNIVAENPEVIYWSYSQSQEGLWDRLRDARKQFELVPSKGSEPDLIIVCKNALIIIEAKLTASNRNKPGNLGVEHKYVCGGQGWWSDVFHSDFKEVAVSEKKYELSRFWLLGTWIAKQLDLDFYLVNLVRLEQERDIEQVFGKHINIDTRRTFVRITWEDICDYIASSDLSNKDKDAMVWYFRNKTIGYNGRGELQRAFSIP